MSMPSPEQPAQRDDWDQHWNAYADAAERNPAQAYRRALVLAALGLDAAPRPVRLLEIGSGQGDLSRDLKRSCPHVELVGIDLSETGLAIARQKVPDGEFFVQDLTAPLALPDKYRGWATHAVCTEVLEHIDDPLTALRNASACLAPGARLVITVPGGPMSAFDRHIGHRGHFTPTRLEALLLEAGFQVAALHGAGFPFFNLYRLAVIARGSKLITDVEGANGLSLSARAAMGLFSWLFRYNADRTRRGWQLVATAIKPSA
jgi:SAM-dependent methyltransferase